MKKISKLLVLFILLFSVGITSASASTYTFHKYKKNNSELLNAGLITYDWYEETDGHELCANSTRGACRPNSKYFDLYYVENDSGLYITYTINPNKGVNDGTRVNEFDNINIINFSDFSITLQEKERRINLLKTLLLFGYNPAPNNDKNPAQIVETDPHNYLKMIAMQVLVNEILEGGRRSFDNIGPDWTGQYSFYDCMIRPNGGDNPTRTDTLYYYYKSFVEAARKADRAKPSTAFDKGSYTLSWDTANKKYKTVVNGLGDYNNCKSDDNNIQTYVSGESLTILSSKPVNNKVITCQYFRGIGASNQTKDEYFNFYEFNLDSGEYSQLVYGSGWKIFKKSFTVSTEKTNLKIKKVDNNGKNVDGAKFTLTQINNQSYSVNITGNGSEVELNKSGNYVVSETPPKGYGKINDFNIKINANTHKIDSCDKEKRDSNGNVISCLNNQVLVSYSNNKIELKVINVAKAFNIMNIDTENKYIYGSEFDIKDSKGVMISSIITSASSLTPMPSLNAGEYNIVQTEVRYPYKLPKDEKERTTKIKIDNNRSLFVYNNNQKTYTAAGDGIVKITNYSTKFNVHAVGHSNPLEGVQFELYNSNKTNKIKCEMVSIGEYNFIDDQNAVDNYVYVTDSNGNISFNYLPEGKYYLKEINTVPPYVLPTGNGVYTEIVLKIDSKGVSVNGSYANNTIEISNTPNSFNFYKRDAEGNVLTTGKYKLQKYDKEANKFVDLKLKEVENDGTYNPDTVIYKVDNKNGKIQFTLTKGMATFIDMESSSTYRIIETVAPEGYTKASTKDTAIVQIDEFGNASGLLVLVDQKIVKDDDSAYAELIINIQTGKQRIMYAAVIVIVVSIIAGLIFYNKKK